MKSKIVAIKKIDSSSAALDIQKIVLSFFERQLPRKIASDQIRIERITPNKLTVTSINEVMTDYWIKKTVNEILSQLFSDCKTLRDHLDIQADTEIESRPHNRFTIAFKKDDVFCQVQITINIFDARKISSEGIRILKDEEYLKPLNATFRSFVRR